MGIPLGITSSAVGLKICAATTGIKKKKSIIRKKEKKHGKIVLLANTKWNTLEVIIPILLIKTFISHDEFVLVNNVLKEYVWYKRKI